MKDFYAIIPAGGAGTRLWPLSRKNTPKFLVDLTGSGKTMLQSTVARLAPVAGEKFVVVTGTAHLEKVRAQLPHLKAESFIAEISGRDSMAAIGLAAAVIARRHGDVVIGSFAADHVIKDESAFLQALRSAQAVAEAGYICTIGIHADYPATGFGYIESGARLSLDTHLPAYTVKSFTEKPNSELAKSYLAHGGYYWNAGMFVSRTDVLLGALERFEPELYSDLQTIAKVWDTDQRDDVLARVWQNIKKIAIDHAIAEPLALAGGMAVVPSEMGWSDVGDYLSLSALSQRAQNEPHGEASGMVTGEAGGEVSSTVKTAPNGKMQPVLLKDSPAASIYTYSKPVVALGIPELVLVETNDVIFVTTKEKSQQVKDLVADLPPELSDLQ